MFEIKLALPLLALLLSHSVAAAENKILLRCQLQMISPNTQETGDQVFSIDLDRREVLNDNRRMKTKNWGANEVTAEEILVSPLLLRELPSVVLKSTVTINRATGQFLARQYTEMADGSNLTREAADWIVKTYGKNTADLLIASTYVGTCQSVKKRIY